MKTKDNSVYGAMRPSEDLLAEALRNGESAEKKQSRQALVILGMHRSGTSAISGALCHLGASMPKTPMPGTPNNPCGHFESLEVWRLNEEILKATGSSWDDWSQFDEDWLMSSSSNEMAARAQAVLAEEYGSGQIVLLKDPRVCRFFPFWRTALENAGFAPAAVHILRDPIEVAASLKKRNDLHTGIGLLLWLRHVLDAERESRDLPRVFVNYSSLLEDWVDTVDRISATLHVEWPVSSDQVQQSITEFLRPELRHFGQGSSVSFDSGQVSSWIQETYEIVRRWASASEKTTDWLHLDRIRAEFNLAVPAFIGLVEESRTAGAKVKSLSAEIEKAKLRFGSYELKLADLSGALARTRDSLGKAEAASRQVRTELLVREAETKKLKQQLEDVTRQRELSERRLRESQNEIVILIDRVLRTEAYKEELLASTSWRLTKPLRGVSRLLGRHR